MSASLSTRIILDALIVISLIMLPWWLTALLAIGGIIVFDYFLEALIAGFVMDSLYGAPAAYFHGLTFIATLCAAVILAAAMYIKPKLR